MSFVHFGCWNYGKCNLETPENGMSLVIKKLIDDSISPDFFIVAGDNYYPQSSQTGKKIFNKEDFNSGMSCVKELMTKTEKPVFMLMGNHDLQYEMALYADDESPESLDKCTLIENQVRYSKDFNFNSNGFMIADTKTLCLFINSVLYTEKKSDVYDCVKKYREEEYRGFESIEEITAHEEEKLKELVESSGEIKNIVVCAHDPIITRRRKVKSREEIIKKFKKKKGRMPTEKEIEEKLFQDIRKPLLDKGLKFLNELYNMVPSAKKYYLCADTHQYQYGIVELGENKIEQYVVGTGGTKCDMDEIPIDETEVRVGTDPELNVSLQIKETIRSFGYLNCKPEAENLKCQFIEVAPCDAFDEDPSEGGPAPMGGRRRKNKTRKKKRT